MKFVLRGAASAAGSSIRAITQRHRISCLCLAATALWWLGATGASAATFNIANGNVAALKGAINTANGNGEADVITLAVGGTYTLTALDNNTAGGNGLPLIVKDILSTGRGADLVIEGRGATIRRSSSNGIASFRILQLADGANVAIKDVIISNGKVVAGFETNGGGGGIYTAQKSTLTLTGCTFSGNFAQGGDGRDGTGGFPNGGFGYSGFGGGLYGEGGVLSATNCTFTGNTAKGGTGGGSYSFGFTGRGGGGGFGYGGGVAATNGVITLTDCTFSSNLGTGGDGGPGSTANGTPGLAYAGGLYTGANTTATRCIFTSNSATYAGALQNTSILALNESTLTGNTALRAGAIDNYSPAGSLTLTRCTLANNSGSGLVNFGPATISESTFESNSAPNGGGIHHLYGTLTVTSSTFKNNSATNPPGSYEFEGGGAIFNEAALSVINCTLSQNTAASHGGAIFNGRGSFSGDPVTLVLRNSTLSANTTSGTGGGLYVPAGGPPSSAMLANTIFQAGAAGLNIVNGGAAGTISSQGYNLSSDNGGGFLTGPGDKINTDPRLRPLGFNGGLTATHSLLPGSPAIDQGKSFGVTADQRGQARPDDNVAVPNAAGGDGSDIGAYEVGTGGLFVVTTTADTEDGTCDAANCTLREAIGAANAQVDPDTIRFAAGVTGTIQLASPLPPLGSEMMLEGPGANLLTVRRDTGGEYRIFTVSNGTTIGPVVSVSGLSLTNGNTSGSFPDNSGGGILNVYGQLTLSRVTISGNVADSFGGGGGVYNYGANSGSARLSVSQSTFSGNNGHIGGGAIYNDGANGGNATLVLTNTTFSSNVTGFNSAAILNADSGGNATTAMTNCTIADSFGPAIAAGAAAGSVTLANNLLKAGQFGAFTLVGQPGTIISQGNNLSSDAAGGDGGTGPGGFLNVPGDLRNTNPQLAAAGLTNNGGATMTIALSPGSPAVNSGNDAKASPTDQRGYLRNGVSDIGAFEFGGIELRIITVARNGADIVVTFQAAAGKTFHLERKLSLADSAWQNIPGVSDLTPSNTGPAPITDPVATSLGRAFYRVRLLP